MNSKIIRYILFLIFCSAFFYACNEGPTEVGYNFLQDTTLVKKITSDDTTLIYDLKAQTRSPMLFNMGRMFVGKANGIEAISIIRFANIPDTLSYLQESDIVSVTLYFSPERYALGDTINGANPFIIKKVNLPWAENATWDSISVPNFMGYQIG
ncbi:MAG TPA: hypothetical protein P5216_02095, partial [Bacteroidota bacterium]|nr:hypothetical protein [Bacteroidota bacterium]